MAFATTDDVATRLGRLLTAAEAAMVQQVIDIVTGLITAVAGEDAAWATALTPVPAYYKALCIEKAIAVGSNPNQLVTHSEQLGAYQNSKRFPEGGWSLTDLERDVIKQINGSGISGSVRVPSLVHDVYVTEDE